MDGIKSPNISGLNQLFRFAQNLWNDFDQLPV